MHAAEFKIENEIFRIQIRSLCRSAQPTAKSNSNKKNRSLICPSFKVGC